MSTLAAIRADSVNLPLFLHVLGAMVLTGTLLTVVMTGVLSRTREGDVALGLRRLGLKAVVVGVLPAYLLMRIGAQWTESEENLPKEVQDSTWLGIGYIAADLGALLIIVSIVLAALGLRRMRASEGTAGGEGQARAITVISIILLIAYVVAVWAMSTKPD